MRALEMILFIVPSIFLDQSRPNSDILLGRICQLVIQVLSRVTLPPGCFQHVIDLCLPDLTYVTHFSIITAAIGILLALMKNELNMEENIFKIPKISRIILTDPSFQIAHLQFALGIAEQMTSLVAIPRGNFDPQMRANIDPLTNESRSSPKRAASGREIIPDPPIIKFNLRDCK
jgi:Kip1 ubiquitination-promoting complex protein 1